MSAGISVIPALSVKFRFGFDMNTRFKLKRRYENTIGYHVSFGTRMILPTTIALVMIFLIPVIFVTYMSFQEWSMSLVKKPEFVGFENYMRALSSRDFWNSMRATALFTGIGVILQVFIGVSVARFVNRDFFCREIFRAILILPLAATPVAIALVWRLMLSPTLGILNYFVTELGLDTIPWLSERRLAMIALLFVDTWQWFPLISFVTLSAMSTIDEQLFESAQIDGASSSIIFYKITLPLIRPSIVVVTMLRLTDSLKHFDAIYVMTQGGPGNATQIMNLYIYENGFKYFKMGYASAVIIILFVLILFANVILARFRRGSN